MTRRTTLGFAGGLLAIGVLAGCHHDGEWSLSKTLGWEPTNAVKTPSLKDYPKPDLRVAERVENLGRQIIAQNTFTGLEPMFMTVGLKEPLRFHRGNEELFISDGLANRAKTNAELP